MTAIITDKIRKQLVQSIYDELASVPGDSDNYYYVAVGHSQQYDPAGNTDVAPTPTNTDREEKKFRYNMQSVKAVEAYSFVIPLYDWTANTIYSAYNDNVVSQPDVSYYVRTSTNNVYLCVRTGKNATGTIQVSTVQPTHTSTALTPESDGYVWKYLYTITTSASSQFLTTAWMPVKFVDSASSTDPDYSQYTIQNAAVDGALVGVRVTTSGGPYTSAPSVSIVGNGTGATARAILNASGGVQAIEIGDSSGAPIIPNMGSGYTKANVVISSGTLSAGGTAAAAVPIFGPKGGLGADARNDLRSTAIMFNIKPEGTVSDKWVVGNDYRQVGLLRNITQYDSAALFTGTQGLALNRMRLTTLPGTGVISYENDVTMTGNTSGGVAFLDYYDDSNTLWYHQDEYTGFTPFQDGEIITVSGYTASVLTADSALVPGDIDIMSGDLLYIDNRATSVTRDVGQTEDIKLVIEL